MSDAGDDRLLVLYDADCGICTRVASILRRLDRARRLRLVPLQQPPSIPDLPAPDVLAEALHARDATGTWTAGGDAVIRLSREIPVLRPLAIASALPGVGGLVDRGYRFVAGHRWEISRLLGQEACRLPSRSSATGAETGDAGAAQAGHSVAAAESRGT